MAPLRHRRHGPNPDRRRSLELLASYRDGCSEAIMLTHGFKIADMVDMVCDGLATASAERVVVGGHTMEVATVEITDAGRRVLG
jgi:hypothetical protein